MPLNYAIGLVLSAMTLNYRTKCRPSVTKLHYTTVFGSSANTSNYATNPSSSAPLSASLSPSISSSVRLLTSRPVHFPARAKCQPYRLVTVAIIADGTVCLSPGTTPYPSSTPARLPRFSRRITKLPADDLSAVDQLLWTTAYISSRATRFVRDL